MNFYATDHAVQRYLERAAQGMTPVEALQIVTERAERAYWQGALRGSATGKLTVRHEGLEFVLDERPDGYAVVTVFFFGPTKDRLREMIDRFHPQGRAAEMRRRRKAERRAAMRHRR